MIQYVCLYILYVHIIYVLLFRKKARNVENLAFFSLSTVSCRASRCRVSDGFCVGKSCPPCHSA